jgi:hypothetical protein
VLLSILSSFESPGCAGNSVNKSTHCAAINVTDVVISTYDPEQVLQTLWCYCVSAPRISGWVTPRPRSS